MLQSLSRASCLPQRVCVRAMSSVSSCREALRDDVFRGRAVHPVSLRPGGRVDVDVLGEVSRAGLVSEDLAFATEEHPSQGWVPLRIVQAAPEPGTRRPAVIMLHATGSRKETLLPLQISYAQAGYLTAAIDCRYHGERGIDPGVRHVATGAYSAALIDAWRGKTCERPFLLDNVFDVVHLLDVLCARGDVDAQRLGITGISLGGMHSWLAAVLDERIAAAAPMIGVQNFQWAIDHDQVQGRVSSLPALFAAASSDLGSQSPTPAVVSAVWARLLPRLLPRPAAVAGAAGATGASASEGASDAAVGAGGTADGRAVAAPTAAAGAAGAGPTDGAASAAAAAAAPVSAAAACYDAPASLPCIAPRALLVANGECDPRCPLAGVCGAMVGARAAYETAGCPERLELFVDVGRGHETSPQMQAAVRAWFDRWLLTSAAK